VSWGEVGDGGVLGGFDAADGEPGGASTAVYRPAIATGRSVVAQAPSPVQRPSQARVSGIHRAASAALPAGTESGAVTSAPESIPQAPRPRAERQRPVRITVDLVPELHAFLKDWAQERGIAEADVVRQLVRELRDDPAVRARVETEIETRQARVREAQRLAQE